VHGHSLIEQGHTQVQEDPAVEDTLFQAIVRQVIGKVDSVWASNKTCVKSRDHHLQHHGQMAETFDDGCPPVPASLEMQEMLWIRRKILSGTGAMQSRFTFMVQQGQIVGGGALRGYMNPFAMSGGPSEIPIMVHPNLPPGTVLFLTDTLPYAMNNITNVLQIRCRRDYYQTEWPRRTRAYEYGVYTDQVLQNFFMPGMYVLTNLSPA